MTWQNIPITGDGVECEFDFLHQVKNNNNNNLGYNLKLVEWGIISYYIFRALNIIVVFTTVYNLQFTLIILFEIPLC